MTFWYDLVWEKWTYEKSDVFLQPCSPLLLFIGHRVKLHLLCLRCGWACATETFYLRNRLVSWSPWSTIIYFWLRHGKCIKTEVLFPGIVHMCVALGMTFNPFCILTSFSFKIWGSSIRSFPILWLWIFQSLVCWCLETKDNICHSIYYFFLSSMRH